MVHREKREKEKRERRRVVSSMLAVHRWSVACHLEGLSAPYKDWSDTKLLHVLERPAWRQAYASAFLDGLRETVKICSSCHTAFSIGAQL